MKTAQRKSFPVYTSWKKPMQKLSLEEKGILFDNLMRYHCNEEMLEMTDRLEMFWDTIEYNLVENTTKYNNKVEKMKENSKSNSKLQNTQSRVNEDPILESSIPDIGSQNTLNRVSNDKDKVNENENEKENEKGNVNEILEICQMLGIKVTEWNSLSLGKKKSPR